MKVSASIARHYLKENLADLSKREEVKTILDQRGLSVVKWETGGEEIELVLSVEENPDEETLNGTIRDLQHKLDANVSTQKDNGWKIIVE